MVSAVSDKGGIKLTLIILLHKGGNVRHHLCIHLLSVEDSLFELESTRSKKLTGETYLASGKRGLTERHKVK